jgi:hypothetical protein
MKGFIEEWDQGRNHRDRSEEGTANCRIPHFKSNSRIKVKEHRSGDLCGAQASSLCSVAVMLFGVRQPSAALE